MALARHWGPLLFGQFTLAFIYAATWCLIFDFGLDPILTQHTSIHRYGIPKRLIYIKTLAMSGGMIAALAGCKIGSFPSPTTEIFLCGAFFFSTTNFLNGILRGIERADIESKIGILQKTIFVVTTFLIIHCNEATPLTIALAYTISQVLATLLTIFFFPSKHNLLKLSPVSATSFNGKAFSFFLIAVFVFLAPRIDVFLLKYLGSPNALGQYSGAFRIIEGAMYLIIAFSISLLPKATQAYINNKNNYIKTMTTSLMIALAYGCLAAFLLHLSALYIANYFFPETPLPLAQFLRKVCWVIPLTSCSLIGGYGLIAQNKPHTFTYALCLGLIIDVIVSTILIPQYGLDGVVAGYWSRELTVFFFLLYFGRPQRLLQTFKYGSNTT